MMAEAKQNGTELFRLIVVGGHTRNIGKTQLVCDIIHAFPKVYWIAGKITQQEGGLSARDVESVGCAPTEHNCLLDWETRTDTETDSARVLKAGATRSFWLRSRQGALADCLPLLRQALCDSISDPSEPRKKALIVESNSLVQLVKPSLYFAVLHPDKEDFKESALAALGTANALVLRADATPATPDAPPAPLWMKVPSKLLQQRPSVLQRQGEPLPRPLESLIYQMLDDSPSVSF